MTTPMLATVMQDSGGMFPHQPARTSSSQVVLGVTPTLAQRTNALVRGLILILEHHGAGCEVVAELPVQLSALLDDAPDEMVWLSRAKWLLTYPLARYLRNELPASCDRNFSPTGCLRRWMRQRLTAFNRRNTHLWYSWLQAKRSALPASEAIVEETYKKHLVALTSVDPGVDSTIDKIFQDPCFQRVLERARSSFTEKLRNISNFPSLAPSTSACYELPRSKGGQQTTLVVLSGLESEIYEEENREIASDDGIEPTDDPLPATGEVCPSTREPATMSQTSVPFTRSGDMLVRMRFYPVVHRFDGFGRMTNVCAEVREKFGRDDWVSLHNVYLNRTYGRPLRAVIQAVLEPFKVRVISKGESLPYYAMRPIQKALHGALRSMPCFRLIGRPFSPTDVLDLALKAESSWEWFSVDYSAATDGLSWKYSGRILRFLLGNLSQRGYEYALRVLGPHELLYPQRRMDKWGAPVSKGVQTNGQLMGSILSFPILCLANLGVYLKVTAPSQGDWSDEERLNHVLVNGDDMVYAAPPALWEKHVSVAGKVGLKMSVGKAYRHPVYLNVNSTSCHYDLKTGQSPARGGLFDPWGECPESYPDGCASYVSDPALQVTRRQRGEFQVPKVPWQIDFLNVGLFFGQHKVLGKSDDPEVSEVFYAEGEARNLELAAAHFGADPAAGYCANINRLLVGSLPDRQVSLLGAFISVNRDELLRECAASIKFSERDRFHTRNMFLPISLGGMGVSPPLKWAWRVSAIDQKIASTIVLNSSLRPSFGLPRPGFEPLSIDEVSCPWVEKREWLPLGMAQMRPFGMVKIARKREIKNPVFWWSASPSAVAR